MKPALLERIFNHLCRRDGQSRQQVIVKDKFHLGIYLYRVGELERKKGFVALGVEDQIHPELKFRLIKLCVWPKIPANPDYEGSRLEITMSENPKTVPSMKVYLRTGFTVGESDEFSAECLATINYAKTLFEVTEGKG